MRLLAPTTLKREMLKTSLRVIVPASQLPCVRRVTLLVPPSEGVFAGIDENVADVGSDRFQWKLAQLPVNRDVVFHLQPHQVVTAAVRAGTVALGVLVEHLPEGT